MEQSGSDRAARRRRSWQRNPRLAEQVLGGKAVVLHYEGRRVLGLNDTGTLVWTLTDGARSAGEIATLAARRLSVPEEERAAFEAAVLDFIDELARRELLVRADEGGDGDGAPEFRAGGSRRRGEAIPEEGR